jgi:hypothetical protein
MPATACWHRPGTSLLRPCPAVLVLGNVRLACAGDGILLGDLAAPAQIAILACAYLLPAAVSARALGTPLKACCALAGAAYMVACALTLLAA